MLQHRLPPIENVIQLSIISKNPSNWQGLRNISRDSKLINLLRNSAELFGRNILADGSFKELLLPLYDLSHSRPLLNEVELLLFNGGEFISLVVL